MRFSRRKNSLIILLLIILNIILRLQVTPREFGFDSFLMHTMINSLTEFGYAKWVLHPLSFAGLYPYSYTSSVLFLLSGVQQTTNLDMNAVIFIYTIFQAVLSVFAIHLMSGSIIDNDYFKHLVAFIFSTSSAVVSYTTYTIGTRSLVIILVPLLVYLLIHGGKLYKKVILIFILIPFLFVTHHLIFFILPTIIVVIISKLLSKIGLHNFFSRKIPDKYVFLVLVLIPIILFLVCFSIPFVFKKFLYTGSRYRLPVLSYIRYMGPSIIYSISGMLYLSFNHKKSFNEWILLLSTISLVSFIYIDTYMQWFLPIFLAPLAGISIMNLFKLSLSKKHMAILLILIITIPTIFTGYYQFIKFNNQDSGYEKRHIEESTYNTGLWIRQFTAGNAISNDQWFSYRISAVSDTTHFLVPFTTIDAIYGFIDTNVSLFERYPLSSEEFWFNGYEGPDVGQQLWDSMHKGLSPLKSEEFEIKYIAEKVIANGNVIWNHQPYPSKIIELAHQENLIFDVGDIRLWHLNGE